MQLRARPSSQVVHVSSFLPGRRSSAATATPPLLPRMVFISDWDVFYAEAEKLYTEHPEHVSTTRPLLPAPPHPLCGDALRSNASPLTLRGCRECRRSQTRFVTKYRHCDGKLELKVTNDRVVSLPAQNAATERCDRHAGAASATARRAPSAAPRLTDLLVVRRERAVPQVCD